MVKIRLRRIGARSKPAYRIVAADSRSPRDGAFIEVIGHYNPLTDPEEIIIDKDKALKWLNRGAKPTETVERLLIKSGIIEAKPHLQKQKTEKGKKSETSVNANVEKTTKETS